MRDNVQPDDELLEREIFYVSMLEEFLPDRHASILVCGGGVTGQAGAVRLGISRAVLASDEKFRKQLRQKGLLTVDSRVVERKKPGQPGARRKFQFVKR